MNANPLVSVIILSYNGVAYLENCLDSVENQDYPRDRFEIVVADNGSTDDSVSLLKRRYEDAIVLLEYGTNHGFARGNNIAIGHAKGDLLVLLNQDTIVESEWLSGLVSGIVDGGFDVCHSNMLLPRNEEFENAYKKESPKNIYYYELNGYGYVEQIVRRGGNNSIIGTRFLSGACFIIKRSVIEALGYLFDEDFGSYNEDMELGLRLTRNRFKIGVVPSSVVYHLSSFSFSMSRYNIWKNLIIIRNRFIVFWKSSNSRDFLHFLPRLIISQSHKVFRRSVELNNGIPKSFILACSVLPLSLISFFWFMAFLLRSSGSVPRTDFKTASR